MRGPQQLQSPPMPQSQDRADTAVRPGDADGASDGVGGGGGGSAGRINEEARAPLGRKRRKKQLKKGIASGRDGEAEGGGEEG